MAHVSGNSTWTNTAATPINATALENLEANGDFALPTVNGLWRPANNGLLAWSCDPGLAAGSVGIGNLMTVTAIPVGGPMTVTGMVCSVNTGSANLIAGENFLGLYSPTGLLLAATADQSSNWSAAGAWVAPFAGGPVSITGPNIFYGWTLVNTSSAGVYFSAMTGSPASLNLYRTGQFWRSGYVATSNTVLPATAPVAVSRLNLTWLALY